MTNGPLQSPSSICHRLQRFIESSQVQFMILGLILVNSVTLGIETIPSVMENYGSIISMLDKTILTVFVIELIIRLLVYRTAFFRDPWMVFDFIVVSIALIPATGQFSVLRALRVLRVLRILTIVPSMRRVVGALLSAIPGLSSIALVLLLLFYVFAVIATNLFASEYPEWFGHLGHSFYTLFQIMTLESWSMGIARPVMESFPYAWAFFVPFILVATFTMLNLFIAIIVNAIQTFSESESKETVTAVIDARDHIETDIHIEMQALRQEIAELKSIIQDVSKNRL